jgi:4,5-dihydroxyphthalate decarboxylase
MMPTLTFACGRTDRTQALFDGTVSVAGCGLAMLALPPSEIFPRALNRAEFDICELSASSYLVQVSRGTSEYVALPVFLSRSFRLDAVYIRTDRGIASPGDLAGRRVGTPEFQMTAGLWVRGILQDRYGLDPRSMKHVTGGLNSPGRKERIRIEPGPGFDITPAGDGDTLNAMLARGDIDAVIAPEPPSCWRDGSAPVIRLFPDDRAAALSYFADTGIHPIMHLVAVRRAVLERIPGLASRLFDALVEARNAGYRRLEQMATGPTLALMLPFLASELEATRRAMGDDYWPYGIAANRPALEALCRYSVEQSLSAQPVAPMDLFATELAST